MKSIGEGDDVGTPRHFTGQLQRRFHRIGAGRPGEHHLILQAAGLQDGCLQLLKECLFCVRVHIQAMGHAITVDITE